MRVSGCGQDFSTYAPYSTCGEQHIEALSFETQHMGVNRIMCIENRRQDRPAAIHLRVVLVDLRDDEEDRGDEQCEREGGYDRVGVEVDLSESDWVRDRLEEDLRKCFELVGIWEDRVAEVAAVNG